MSLDELFSRQEALAGFPAKRASTLLYLIKNRTVHLAARSHLDFSLSEPSSDGNLAFIEAFATVPAQSFSPTIQHLEYYAPQWADLIPQNPIVKATLAHILSRKYKFTSDRVPQIIEALDLEGESVQAAYLRQYQAPLALIFSVRLSLKEKLHWTAARLARRIEDLPPFWLATLITVALGLPQAFLALPIAAAGMGALSSLALVIAIGAVNILTMTCMAEAIARSGDFHYGKASIKQLATDYLGEVGSFLLSLAVGIRVFLIALACCVGLSTTMANFTPISPYIWAAVLFASGICLLSRQSVKFTVAIMILLAGVNIALLSGLSLLAFTHLEIGNLFYFNLPFTNKTFEPQLIQQVFGVSLMLYFGHVYVGECAKLVLPKDRSGSSLIKGSIAGTIILTILFCIWILAVNGAIAPSLLAIQSGTVLEPLAQQIGLIVTVSGSVLIIFLLGMAWIRSSSLLFSITKEWIPHQSRRLVRLPRERGRIILQPKNKRHYPLLGITYLGLKRNVPLFRFDLQTEQKLIEIDFLINQKWQLAQLPQLSELPNLNLKLELQSVSEQIVNLKVNSNMLLNYEGKLSNADINGIELPSENTDDKNKQQHKFLLNQTQRRFAIAMIPLILVFLLTELLFLTQAQSFTSVLAFAGVLGNSLVGGIFPVLLLISSRRKGELVPKAIWQKLEQPWLLASIYSLFIVILLIHGLFIWQDAIARFSALAVAIMALLATLITISEGAFNPRTVIELHQDDSRGKAYFNVTAAGKPQVAHISLDYGDGQQQYQNSSIEVDSLAKLDYAICQLSTKRSSELKIWAHRSHINGNDEGIPTQLEVYRGNQKMQFDLKLSGGKILLPAIAGACWLKFKFE